MGSSDRRFGPWSVHQRAAYTRSSVCGKSAAPSERTVSGGALRLGSETSVSSLVEVLTDPTV